MRLTHLAPDETSVLYVRTKPGETEAALASLEAVHRKLNPDYPFDYGFLDQDFEAAYRSEAVLGALASVFAVIAVFISCLGLVGLVSFSTEQRTKEIGVRKVMGASVPHLVRLLTGEVTRLVLLGIVIVTATVVLRPRRSLAIDDGLAVAERGSGRPSSWSTSSQRWARRRW